MNFFNGFYKFSDVKAAFTPGNMLPGNMLPSTCCLLPGNMLPGVNAALYGGRNFIGRF